MVKMIQFLYLEPTIKTNDMKHHIETISPMRQILTLSTTASRMCEIIHQRQFRPWMWPDAIFNLFPSGRTQKKLLGIIHGLTKQVRPSKN